MDGLPSSIDWREKGVVNEVRNQGGCNSGWAFAPISAIESAWAIQTGQLLNFSEQQVIDCVDGGCEGGKEYNAYHYFTNHRLWTEDSLPYKAVNTVNVKNEHCVRQSARQTPVILDAYVRLDAHKPGAMINAVAKQPISVSIDAGNWIFQSYESGVFDSTACGNYPTTIVNIVGYGTDEASGTPYWIVRNSWSKDWGEDGHIRIARTEDLDGICGINQRPFYPVVKKYE